LHPGNLGGLDGLPGGVPGDAALNLLVTTDDQAKDQGSNNQATPEEPVTHLEEGDAAERRPSYEDADPDPGVALTLVLQLLQPPLQPPDLALMGVETRVFQYGSNQLWVTNS
jgi:hypothetical protein